MPAFEHQQGGQERRTPTTVTTREANLPEKRQGVWSQRLGRRAARSLLLVFGLVLVVTAGYVLWRLRLVVVPVLIALLLASAFSPLVRWLQDRGVPRVLATWVSLLAAVTVLGGVLAAVVSTVVSRWNELTASVDLGLGRLEDIAAHRLVPFSAEQLRQGRETVLDQARQHLSVADAFSVVSLLTTLIVGLLLAVVVLFFFLKDGKGIWAFLLQPLNSSDREKAQRAGHEAVGTMGGYVRGISLVALADATGIGVVLFVLGVPLALPLAVIVFLSSFVPIVGATLSGAFAVLVTLVTNGPQDALIVAAAVVLVQQLDGNVLQPLIVGQAVSLHPLVVLTALTAGSVLAGVIGAVLAVPLVAVAWTMATAWRTTPATHTDQDHPAPG